MQLGAALSEGIKRLKSAGVPSPRMNAELLLMFVLGRDRAHLYGHAERELTADERSRYEEALAQRATGMPAQYITGHQEFWGMDLIVSPAVLIPRPETEHVVEAVLDRVKASCESSVDQPSPANIRVVDVGTGSGCIALALAKELPHAQLHATDISSSALELARANAARHQLQHRIQFYETDLLSEFGAEEFEVVVSNPPYVGNAEEDQVQLEVRRFEPRNAVFAGPDGMKVIARLVPEARRVLKPRGWLIMELSGTIAERVLVALREWDDVQITNDLQGIPRVASARKS